MSLRAAKSSLRPFKKLLLSWIEVLRANLYGRRWGYVTIHRRQLTTSLPAWLTVPLLCRPVKGALSCPDNLTIVLIHDYPEPPVMERSLRYTGINRYEVLRPQSGTPWKHTKKIDALLQYLESGACSSDYILYCDSNDAVLRNNPAKAIQLLDYHGCELLFSTTPFKGTFECMPDVQHWAEQNDSGPGSEKYLNSGIYIGKTGFIKETLQRAVEFVTDQDLTLDEYNLYRSDGTLCRRLPDFPHGVGADQAIFRFLHPRLYPRLRVDTSGVLALRGGPDSQQLSPFREIDLNERN